MRKMLRVPRMGNRVPNPEPVTVTVQMPTFGPWATHSPNCKRPCCN